MVMSQVLENEIHVYKCPLVSMEWPVSVLHASIALRKQASYKFVGATHFNLK